MPQLLMPRFAANEAKQKAIDEGALAGHRRLGSFSWRRHRGECVMDPDRRGGAG